MCYGINLLNQPWVDEKWFWCLWCLGLPWMQFKMLGFTDRFINGPGTFPVDKMICFFFPLSMRKWKSINRINFSLIVRDAVSPSSVGNTFLLRVGRRKCRQGEEGIPFCDELLQFISWLCCVILTSFCSLNIQICSGEQICATLCPFHISSAAAPCCDLK